MNVAPVLFGRFNIDHCGRGQPISLFGILELHVGVVHFATQIVEAKVVQATVEGRNQSDDSSTGFINPDVTAQLQRMSFAR